MVNLLAAIVVAMSQTSNDAGHEDVRFPDTPKNHWAYQAVADLHSIGLQVGVPDGLGRAAPPRDKYVFAVMTHAAYSKLHEIVLDLERSNEAVARFAGHPEDEPKELQESEKSSKAAAEPIRKIIALVEKDLLKLTKEFTPQLKTLGAEVAPMAGRIRRDCQTIASNRSAKPREVTK